MVAFLRKKGSSCRTLLVEETDRLYRNIKDWVTMVMRDGLADHGGAAYLTQFDRGTEARRRSARRPGDARPVESTIISPHISRRGHGMVLTSGATLGPYVIQPALGEHGMGRVYRARDPRLDCDLAITCAPGF